MGYDLCELYPRILYEDAIGSYRCPECRQRAVVIYLITHAESCEIGAILKKAREEMEDG